MAVGDVVVVASVRLGLLLATVFHAVGIHLETDLYLPKILPHFLNLRNLSLHDLGGFDNLVDELHLRNLHGFLQFGWSEPLHHHVHVCLLLRVLYLSAVPFGWRFHRISTVRTWR